MKPVYLSPEEIMHALFAPREYDSTILDQLGVKRYEDEPFLVAKILKEAKE